MLVPATAIVGAVHSSEDAGEVGGHDCSLSALCASNWAAQYSWTWKEVSGISTAVVVSNDSVCSSMCFSIGNGGSKVKHDVSRSETPSDYTR